MQMSKSNDDDLRCFRLVNDTVWETPQLAAPNVATQRRPRLRKLPNALNGEPGFVPELAAQTSTLLVVKVDGLDQLALAPDATI